MLYSEPSHARQFRPTRPFRRSIRGARKLRKAYPFRIGCRKPLRARLPNWASRHGAANSSPKPSIVNGLRRSTQSLPCPCRCAGASLRRMGGGPAAHRAGLPLDRRNRALPSRVPKGRSRVKPSRRSGCLKATAANPATADQPKDLGVPSFRRFSAERVGKRDPNPSVLHEPGARNKTQGKSQGSQK